MNNGITQGMKIGRKKKEAWNKVKEEQPKNYGGGGGAKQEQSKKTGRRQAEDMKQEGNNK